MSKHGQVGELSLLFVFFVNFRGTLSPSDALAKHVHLNVEAARKV